MAISKKAKEKIDDASKEVKDALENLKREVAGFKEKIKGRIKGTGEEVQQSIEEVSKELKNLSEKVKELITKKRGRSDVPVRVDNRSVFHPEILERPSMKLRRETDRLFDEFYRNLGWPRGPWGRPWDMARAFEDLDWPRADIQETDGEVRVTAELPGVSKEDIEVSLVGDRVIISGEKKQEEEEKGRGFFRLERSYGAFHRSFVLPCEVDASKVDASFSDGVLKIKLPKTESSLSKRKRITVKEVG